MARGIKVLAVFGLNWLLSVIFLFWFDIMVVSSWFPQSTLSQIRTPPYQIAIYLAIDLIINGLIAAGAYWLVRKDLQDIPIRHKWTFYFALVIIFSVIITTIVYLFNFELNQTFNILFTPTSGIAIFLTIPFLIAISGPILGYQSRPWFVIGLVIEVLVRFCFFAGFMGRRCELCHLINV
ncbi:hypothetical protein [Lentilactobacillus kefiri]|uniref:Uncharacterized protein n=2 Tax=Lentilactobacillus kefiri TaxID=33962 RepID=A0A8E1RJA3_LENKE|nr:hypothetical protein [Lentilactobacillus kefiri]KRL73277.1 hypothetical protein FD08_GL002761 [Lentilactobacillus parakefiri DSM 10551]KRM50061.1 hypothetical protein FC95_GL002110 [Lentilactobacillus kefiri DSM 20587 = JCM 5818]MCJ2162361.1 hypothetical protein [Lentilactobacillus kefiri]MCP9369603.1 hypothetical protein [Lentilactobacillus kefiri]MDH5108931.1 hypothetical protein [Lentilactobacillus kefiri]